MNLSPRLYKEAIKTVESAILSTDLALYFKKKGSFQAIIEAGEKDWIETEKRDTLRWNIKKNGKVGDQNRTDSIQQGTWEKDVG